MGKTILKALTEGTAAAGGNTVPNLIADRILEFIQANTVTIPDMDQSFNMVADDLRIPSLTSGSTIRKGVAEVGSIAGADVGFGQLTLSALKMAALMTISTELMEDSQNNIPAIVQQQFAKDMALETDRQILAGTGTAEFTGLTGGVNASNTFSSGTLSWTKFLTGNDKVLAGNHPLPDRIYTNPANITKMLTETDGSARPILNMETFGSPTLKSPGAIGLAFGAQVKATTQLTTSMILGGVAGRMGYYSVRRSLTQNRFYEISTDDWIYQANMRHAFVTKHSKAIYLMTSVS